MPAMEKRAGLGRARAAFVRPSSARSYPGWGQAAWLVRESRTEGTSTKDVLDEVVGERRFMREAKWRLKMSEGRWEEVRRRG